MPSITTSASGFRVLHKNNRSQSNLSTASSSEAGGTPPGSVLEGSSSATSSKRQSKMRRFPSLLSSKNKDHPNAASGADSSNSKHRASQSLSTSGSRRNTSMSGVNAPTAAASPGGGAAATHSRSVSLASAPSGLPRPTGSTTTAAPYTLPTSVSQPVMPKPPSEPSGATTPSGIPQAKRVAPPSATPSPSSNTISPATSPPPAVASTPSRIPALTSSSTSPVNRTGTTTAGQFVPSPSVNGHSKNMSESSFGYRTASQFSASPSMTTQSPALGASSDAPAVVAAESETPTKAATAGAGVVRSPSGLPSTGSGIPRLRNISETSGGDKAAAATANGTSRPGSRSGTATPPTTETGNQPVNMYPRSRDASGTATSNPASLVSEGSGSRVSNSRGPLPTVPVPGVSTQQASNSTVPAMWRTSSYEGSTKAYLNSSSSMSRSASSSSQGSPSVQGLSGKQGYIGVEGLQALENKYLSGTTAPGVINEPVARQNSPAVQHRIRLIRKLADIRGERILQGVDVEKIVWLEGTNLHLTTDQELAMARNGSIITDATASPIPGNTAASSINSSTSPTALPPVPGSPRAKKQGLFHKMAASFGGGGSSGHARKTSNASSIIDSPESKRGQVVSGSASLPGNKQNDAAHLDKAKLQGPIFGVRIADAPPLAYAVSIIGGQRHQLPILVFSLVEAIFRRGIDTSGIFRINGDADSISRLVGLYNTYPSYGDDVILGNETIFTLCDLLKRYLKDMPEAVLPTALWNVFVASCLHETGGDPEKEHIRKLAAAQIIFRLLPRKNMSLLIYLTAFLFQLPLHASNRLTVDSIAVIFGPAILAPRTGLSTSMTANVQDSNTKRSQEGLKWLLDNWDDSLSQDLLDEEYNALATPDLAGAPWTAGQSSESEGAGDLSRDEPRLQHSPQKMAFLQTNSPAMSMAASPAMMPSFTQQTAQTMETDPERSPVPEGWGEAISPNEDAAILQRQMLLSKPRKSSYDIDPAFSSPTRSEFGLLPAGRPLSTVAQTDGEQGSPAENVEAPLAEASLAEVPRGPSPDKPRSLKSTKSSRSLQDLHAAHARSGEDAISIPGGLPLPTTPVAEPSARSEAAPVVPRAEGPGLTQADDRSRQISDSTEVTGPSETGGRPESSVYTISARDSQSTKTSFPMHSRKESLRSEEGRTNSTFGGPRSASYGGRPQSYARSDAQFSDSGYVPEEITADPNAARLFGSLGELFMSERRKAAEYQHQLRQLEQRAGEHEEHIHGLQQELEDRDQQAKCQVHELETLRASAQQHGSELSKERELRDSLNSEHKQLQDKHHSLQSTHQDLQTSHDSLQSTVKRLEARLQQDADEHKRVLLEAEESRSQERRALVAEISALREQVETHGRERDLAKRQLAQIKALLEPAV